MMRRAQKLLIAVVVCSVCITTVNAANKAFSAAGLVAGMIAVDLVGKKAWERYVQPIDPMHVRKPCSCVETARAALLGGRYPEQSALVLASRIHVLPQDDARGDLACLIKCGRVDVRDAVRLSLLWRQYEIIEQLLYRGDFDPNMALDDGMPLVIKLIMAMGVSDDAALAIAIAHELVNHPKFDQKKIVAWLSDSDQKKTREELIKHFMNIECETFWDGVMYKRGEVLAKLGCIDHTLLLRILHVAVGRAEVNLVAAIVEHNDVAVEKEGDLIELAHHACDVEAKEGYDEDLLTRRRQIVAILNEVARKTR